jgi:hypothetical protein
MEQQQYFMMQNGDAFARAAQGLVAVYNQDSRKPVSVLTQIGNTIGEAPRDDQLTYGVGHHTGIFDVNAEKAVWKFNKLNDSEVIYNGTDSQNILAATEHGLYLLDPRVSNDNAVVAQKVLGGRGLIKAARKLKNGANRGITQIAYVDNNGITIAKFHGGDAVQTQAFAYNLEQHAIAHMDAIWAGDVTYVVLLTRQAFLKNNVLLFALEGKNDITRIATQLLLESVDFEIPETTQLGCTMMIGATKDYVPITAKLRGSKLVSMDAIECDVKAKQLHSAAEGMNMMMDEDTGDVIQMVGIDDDE